MEQLLFTVKVGKSLLSEGFTIPVEQQKAVQDAVGALLGRGSHVTIDIYVGEIAYPAKLTNVNLSNPNRVVFQIRYAPDSDICKKVNLLFGEGTGTKEIGVWADGHRHLIFQKSK